MEATSTATAGTAPSAEPPPRSVGGRHNNFTVLRLFAAISVVFSHSFALTARGEPALGKDAVGRIGVVVFFAMSGFLMTQSWLHDSRLLHYGAKRALRIIPALAMVLLLSAFVMGPLVTTLSFGDYLSSTETWTYVLQNLRFHFAPSLPGVFGGNPYPDAVNGSIWTMPIVFHTYVMIAVIGLLGVLKKPRLAVLVLTGVCLVPLVAPGHAEYFFGDHYLVAAFAVGAMLLLWREAVPWKAWIAAALAVAYMVCSQMGDVLGESAGVVAITYGTIFVAYHSPLSLGRLTAKGDLSYGLYLFAFPVQQVIADLWHDIPPLAMFAIALPVTYGLAFASWQLIEAPALRLKSRLSRPERPAVRVPEAVSPAEARFSSSPRLAREAPGAPAEARFSTAPLNSPASTASGE